MKNSLLVLIFLLTLSLIACTTPTPEPTVVAEVEEKAESEAVPTEVVPPTATPTEIPTFTPTPTETPEPTVTSTPAPLPISSENVRRLEMVSFSDLDLKYVGDPNSGETAYFKNQAGDWITISVSMGRPINILWNADGRALLVETNRGIDVLDGDTLEFLTDYPNYQLVNSLDRGEIAALQGKDIVFLNIDTNEANPRYTLSDDQVAVKVSPNGKYLTYATGSRTFDLVNLESGEIRNLTIERPVAPAEITDFIFSPNSDMFFAVHTLDIEKTNPMDFQKKGHHLYAIESGEQFYELVLTTGIKFADNGDYAYFIWGVGAPVQIARPATDYSSEVNVGQGVGFLYSESGKCNSGNLLVNQYSFIGGSSQLGLLYDDIQYERDEACSTIVNTIYNKKMIVRDYVAGEDISMFNEFEQPSPLLFDFSPVGDVLYTFSWDGVIKLWNAKTFEILSTSTQYALDSFADLSPSGTKLAIPFADRIEIWEVSTLDLLEMIYPANPQFLIESIEFLTDEVVYVQGNANRAFNYDLVAGAEVASFSAPERERFGDCRFSENGATQICWVEGERTIGSRTIYNSLTGGIYASFPFETIQYQALSTDGKLVAHCRAQAAFFNLGPVDGQPTPYSYPCQDMLFLPGDTQILLADGTVVGVESKEVEGTFTFSTPYNKFADVFFSPNDDFMMIGIDIYDIATGDFLGQLDSEAEIHGIELSEDGMSLIILTEFGLEYWQVLD